jgi:hypothetical protein
MTQSGGRASARARAASIDTSTLVPLDPKSAQEKERCVYVPYPQPHARQAGVDHQAKVTPVLHAPTGAMIILPPGVELEDLGKEKA